MVVSFSTSSFHTVLTSYVDVNVDADHTYMMFSATFPKSARRLAKEYMEEDYLRIKVDDTHARIVAYILT